MAASNGRMVRFPENLVRVMGRGASGVRGITLDGSVLVGMEVAEPGVDVLVVTENGYGKKTAIDEYRVTNRGGKGVKTLNITDKIDLWILDIMLGDVKKNKMSVVATGILFGVIGVLIIPMIAVIVKISNALSQKHPRIYKYSMIAFIGMLLAISLFCVVIKHQMSFLVIVACLAITLCDTIKNR